MEQISNYTQTRRYLSKSQKEQIVKENLEQGIPIAQLARKNGINAISIYQWKRQMNQNNNALTPEKVKELLQEISKLKQENNHLKIKVADLAVSNDILNDAMEILKKRDLLKAVQSHVKSENQKNSK